MTMHYNAFALHTSKQHAKFISLSALFVGVAFVVVQYITQLGGWFFGAILALLYLLALIGAYFIAVFTFYLLRNKLAINAKTFMKSALNVSFWATMLVSICVALDILIMLTPY